MRKFLFVLLCLLVACVIFLIQQTNSIKTVRYTWESSRVPQGFNGFQIALVSDLHNKRFGKKQARLVRAVEKLAPDMIALTGDFVDKDTKNLDAAREFFEGVKTLAPMYWVDGNHDPNSPFYDDFHAMLAEYGVIVLKGDSVAITRGGDEITLSGYPFWELRQPIASSDIMLYHGPDDFYRFAEQDCGLVLSGHNHGGQVALPNGRALVGPRGGLFPQYSGGVYTQGGSTMVLSRGLGTSVVHLRAFARPEVAGVELRAENLR